MQCTQLTSRPECNRPINSPWRAFSLLCAWSHADVRDLDFFHPRKQRPPWQYLVATAPCGSSTTCNSSSIVCTQLNAGGPYNNLLLSPQDTAGIMMMLLCRASAVPGDEFSLRVKSKRPLQAAGVHCAHIPLVGLAAVGRQLWALSFSVPPPPGPRGKGRRPALGERGGGARCRTAVAAHAAAAGCYGAAPCHLLSARPGLAPGRPGR